MRRDDDLGVPEQRVLGDRLAREHVERGSPDLARLQGAAEGLLIDQPPRATFRTITPSFICAKASSFRKPRVSGVFGRWMVMKSAR